VGYVLCEDGFGTVKGEKKPLFFWLYFFGFMIWPWLGGGGLGLSENYGKLGGNLRKGLERCLCYTPNWRQTQWCWAI
jgi:hypothetical protein